MDDKVKKSLNYKSLPETPGVYIMKDALGRVLYIGKAANLRRRVSSYFERPHDIRIEALVGKIRNIDHKETDTALEALILEAVLIRKFSPPFNVKEKDDKSFLFIEITKEKFPRVVLARGHDPEGSAHRWGPFTSASSAREALRILRRIFPWSTHDPEMLGKFKRPCFDFEIGLCPGTCVGIASRTEYLKNIARLRMFLDGKKKAVLASFSKEMKAASKALDFERAEKLRRQLFSLEHIRDTALISDSTVVAFSGSAATVSANPRDGYRIEGYDISNISGTSAVGSMVVFEDGEPKKSDYRKFKIRTLFEPNDVGMLTEVLERRFKHFSTDAGSYTAAGAEGDEPVRGARASDDTWRLPDLILIDGGVAQVNAARRVLRRAGLNLPMVGIAKGPERKRNDVIGAIPKGVQKATLVRVRDEAHRFAISYHKKLRGIRSLQ